ncbi:hypothetical protein Poli38472_010007 [Pythium oligandrum]|uniref:Uncharacterized protein n=1 Tax=Pythium oligandrum TaxID=41045 RepID=A0A8K1C938_PYTOL|nr:hypothetical protein Poli38472_010007 [Pythium oligandrum]|eukprot:TMW58448.1 hypothetical protein Poli38472_010007 [Pythium oligandrum]
MVFASWKSCTALVASAVALLAAPSAAADSFAVPSFDFASIVTGEPATLGSLVDKLQTDGIISIRNIPQFKELRAEYLEAATKCASSEAAKNSPGLLYKTLPDGTERWTISTKTQFANPQLAQTQLESVCPQYLPVLREFSELVNVAASEFARALDTAAPSVDGSASLEEVVRSAENLDHFHSYSSPSAAPTATKDHVSLELHSDNGLMIFMTAPEFYALRDAPVKVPREAIVAGPDASAGLLIKAQGKPELVQPVLKDDELVVMIGEGFKSWISAGHAFKPVLHAMQMPSFSTELGKVSRSWFGKMVLLPKDRVMKNTGMTFGSYTTKVTEYVLGAKDASTFGTVACPPSMALFESDSSCTLQLFEPKEGSSATTKECMSWCNNPHVAETCTDNCNYVGELPGGGIDCWMLCLPTDVCEPGQEAQCDPSGAQASVCVNTTLPATRF